jgi:hypothetical protein
MTIHSVFLFPNGMVAVTDQEGKQMADLQGSLAEVKREGKLREQLERQGCAGVEWYGCSRDTFGVR